MSKQIQSKSVQLGFCLNYVMETCCNPPTNDGEITLTWHYTVPDVCLTFYCDSNMGLTFDLLLFACTVGVLGIKDTAAIAVSQHSSISNIPTMLVF